MLLTRKSSYRNPIIVHQYQSISFLPANKYVRMDNTQATQDNVNISEFERSDFFPRKDILKNDYIIEVTYSRP
jgi:hypothetical protein